MPAPTISRTLLVLVLIAAAAVAARFTLSSGSDAGLVHLAARGTDAIHHEAFRLDGPARLAVSAVGSFESDSALAAYGWILRREDRAVVWRMTPASAERGRGTLALAADTVALPAGLYDTYFATYGSGARNGRRPWRSDRSKWAIRIDPATPDDAAPFRRPDRPDRRPAPPEGALWSTGPVGPGRYETYGFEVRAPAAVRVYALGEVRNGEPADFAWIDDLSTGRRVWTFSAGNTEHAGGSPRNRKFDGEIRLAPGVYRAVYQSDRTHGPRAWVANPPYDPVGYGLSLFAPEADVGAFDPWSGLPRLVELTPLGHNEDRQAAFTLEDSLRVWVYAVGELSESGSRWDYADLLREGEPVWQMSRAESRHAGGADRNRIAEAYLELPPGPYTLRARTDGSHAHSSWSGEAPHHPERWGVTVFALSPGFRPGSVAVEVEAGPEAPPPPPEPTGHAELPIRLAPLGNDQDVARTFTLDEETTLRVYALGELIRAERYDYGAIRDEDGEVVWEMTRDNTEHAGGAGKNRRFRGAVTLPAGTYTVRFVTDGSHAFGDFRGNGPDDPQAWGIALEAEG